MAKNNYKIEMKENETILDFFKRCCDENGFNVSKIMKYVDYINDYVYDHLLQLEDGTPVVEEWLQVEIVDFADYFLENYGEATETQRMQTYGTRDAFVLNIFYTIVETDNLALFEENYNKLTKFEQRKFDRVYNQFLNIKGDKTFIILDVDAETKADLEPYAILISDEFTKEEIDNAANLLKVQIFDMYINQGIVICIVENGENVGGGNDVKARIFGVVFDNLSIVPLDAKKLLRTFAIVNESMEPTLLQSFGKNDEVEFMDAGFYVNPLGQSEVFYNSLGNKLPERKGRKEGDNVISFSSLIRK